MFRNNDNRIVLICILTFAIILSGCSRNPNYESLVDQLHDFSPEFTTSENDFDFREAVGTWPNEKGELNELLLNEDFFNIYVEKYGLLDLLERYNVHICCNENPDDSSFDDVIQKELNERNETIIQTICNLQAYQDLNTVSFSGSTIGDKHNADGYYGGKKDKKEEKQVKGEFNDSLKDNEIYEEKRTQTIEEKYYGNWMVKHIYGAVYNEGKYGWNNGTFEDEPAKWEEKDSYEVYFCGVCVGQYENIALDQISIELKELEGKWFSWRHNATWNKDEIVWYYEELPDYDSLPAELNNKTGTDTVTKQDSSNEVADFNIPKSDKAARELTDYEIVEAGGLKFNVPTYFTDDPGKLKDPVTYYAERGTPLVMLQFGTDYSTVDLSNESQWKEHTEGLIDGLQIEGSGYTINDPAQHIVTNNGCKGICIPIIYHFVKDEYDITSTGAVIILDNPNNDNLIRIVFTQSNESAYDYGAAIEEMVKTVQ